jgi:hypothetical protein
VQREDIGNKDADLCLFLPEDTREEFHDTSTLSSPGGLDVGTDSLGSL